MVFSLFQSGRVLLRGGWGFSRGSDDVNVSLQDSLESLMNILLSTTPHYTRCIKPNPDCRPLTFTKEEVNVLLWLVFVCFSFHTERIIIIWCLLSGYHAAGGLRDCRNYSHQCWGLSNKVQNFKYQQLIAKKQKTENNGFVCVNLCVLLFCLLVKDLITH